jgi:hypothetical protein
VENRDLDRCYYAIYFTYLEFREQQHRQRSGVCLRTESHGTGCGVVFLVPLYYEQPGTQRFNRGGSVGIKFVDLYEFLPHLDANSAAGTNANANSDANTASGYVADTDAADHGNGQRRQRG